MAENVQAWCSWCFKKTEHELVQRNYLRRNVYQCTGCLHRTLVCRRCDAMVRGHDDWDDEQCAMCDGLLKVWGKKPDVTEMGWCSWCFERTEHRLVQKNIARRYVYECDGCGRRTLRCRSSSKCSGFARGHGVYDDERCIKCDGTVASWDDPEHNRNATKKEAWCSWCFEESTHSLEQVNTIRRHVYTCDACLQRTLPCRKCNNDMARGGPGWDDEFCAKCSSEVTEWEEAKRARDGIFSQEWTKDKIVDALSRRSDYNEKSLQAGMIRPFLFLVSMDPIMRNSVASSLGWTLCTKQYFGDAHAEAWDIISSSAKGIQARTNESWETLNPIARNCNWYETLFHVNQEVFKQKNIKKLAFTESIEGCRSQSSRLCADAEEAFIKNVSLLQQKQMTEQQLLALDQLVDSEEVKELAKHMRAAGINSAEVIRYGINLGYQMVRLGGFSSYIIAVKAAAWMNRRLGTKIVMSQAPKLLASAVRAANGIMWAWLAADVLNLVFGSSHGRLFPAVNSICNQKLLLAAEGIIIEKYYS